MKENSAPRPPKRVSLALQGGGSHGAFTWGVLDALLEDGRIAVEGISGTSAGAVNGAMVAFGIKDGGPETARRMLRKLWQEAEQTHGFGLRPTWLDEALGGWGLDFSPGWLWLDAMQRIASPYSFNPLDINPLRGLLRRMIGRRRLSKNDPVRLFVNATNARTGRLRVFEQSEITADALLASACLPFLSQAVEVDGEFYWDGGYVANPALFPLIERCSASDIIVVQVTPAERPGVPRSPTAIFDRLTEVSFHANLVREIQNIVTTTERLERGDLRPQDGLRPIHCHMIGAKPLTELSTSSKYNMDPRFLEHLHDMGRAAALSWLATSFDAVGRRSTVDAESMLIEEGTPLTARGAAD